MVVHSSNNNNNNILAVWLAMPTSVFAVVSCHHGKLIAAQSNTQQSTCSVQHQSTSILRQHFLRQDFAAYHYYYYQTNRTECCVYVFRQKYKMIFVVSWNQSFNQPTHNEWHWHIKNRKSSVEVELFFKYIYRIIACALINALGVSSQHMQQENSFSIFLSQKEVSFLSRRAPDVRCKQDQSHF